MPGVYPQQLQSKRQGISEQCVISHLTVRGADIANGIVPTSFRSDYVHFNAAGCTAIAAYVYDQSAARGWVAGESIYSSMRHADTPEGDEMALSGTGFPEGKVSAPVGAVYTDTAATNGAIRWIKTAGTGATGWQVEYGDTGIRKLFPPAVTSGTVTIRRIGSVVTLWIDGVTFGTLSGTQSIGSMIPTGFQSSQWWPFSTVGVYGPVRHGRTLSGGSIQIFGLVAGDSLRAAITYHTTDPWPSTLPGTPV